MIITRIKSAPAMFWSWRMPRRRVMTLQPSRAAEQQAWKGLWAVSLLSCQRRGISATRPRFSFLISFKTLFPEVKRKRPLTSGWDFSLSSVMTCQPTLLWRSEAIRVSANADKSPSHLRSGLANGTGCVFRPAPVPVP